LDTVKKVADIIKNSKYIVAFTGAGVSTESNIPDFRSANGLYSQKSAKQVYPPEVILSRSFFLEKPHEFFSYYRNNMIYPDAAPNRCHTALSELEGKGKVKAVITQNIDGLHIKAGSVNVLELHGSVAKNYCMKCKRKYGLDYIMNYPEVVPLCEKCGGIVRPDVVLYEEMLDEDVLSKSVSFIRHADMLLVMGTSLVVHPAAGLINYYRGDKLVLINKSGTPYDNYANFLIHDAAGKVMGEIMDCIANGD
jgi:NAD-dependent deacetylase